MLLPDARRMSSIVVASTPCPMKQSSAASSIDARRACVVALGFGCLAIDGNPNLESCSSKRFDDSLKFANPHSRNGAPSMDIDLSATDLAFRDEVRAFLRTNAYKPGADYTEWRDAWFAKAKAKGGWVVPKWPKQFGGPGWTPTQHYIWEQETSTAMLPFDMPFGVGMLAPILM